MEKNSYLISSKKSRNKNDYIGNNIEQNAYNNDKIEEKKTPLKLTPKLMMDNVKNNDNLLFNSIKKYPSNSLIFSTQQKLNIIDKNNMNDDQYINMNEDNSKISIHWKYDGHTGLNDEKKHFPTKLNIGNYFKYPTNNKLDPIKLYRSHNNNDELFPNYNKLIYNDIINNNMKRKDVNLNKDNISSYDLSNPNTQSQKNILRQNRNKNHLYLDINTNNLYPNDIPNNRRKYQNEEELPQLVNSPSNINRGRNLTDDYDDKQYASYNPKRNNITESRYGDYDYNYINSPMGGDKIRNRKLPPLHYYNERYYLPYKHGRYKNYFYI